MYPYSNLHLGPPIRWRRPSRVAHPRTRHMNSSELQELANTLEDFAWLTRTMADVGVDNVEKANKIAKHEREYAQYGVSFLEKHHVHFEEVLKIVDNLAQVLCCYCPSKWSGWQCCEHSSGDCLCGSEDPQCCFPNRLDQFRAKMGGGEPDDWENSGEHRRAQESTGE